MNCATAQPAISLQQHGHSTDRYRLLFLRKCASEILVAGEPTDLRLPWVEIPRCQRIAESVTARVKERYRFSAICLSAFDSSILVEDRQPHTLYQIMEIPDSVSQSMAPVGFSWVDPHSLTKADFGDAQDATAILEALGQIRVAWSDKVSRPFARPGWIGELLKWVECETKLLGIRLRMGFRQLNASDTFALLRLETDGPALWFKAVGHPNLREFPISVTLSKLLPQYVPTIIATHAKWHGWLTLECPGVALSELHPGKKYELAATTLADLQIASLDKTDTLLVAGCRDVRITTLLHLVDPFLEAMAEQMSQQYKAHPPALNRQQLETLTAQIKEALSGLAQLQIPDSLGHMDFNPGNILCSHECCIFLDWAEASVGPPFMTFEYFCEYIRRMGHTSIGAHLRSLYTKRWESVLSAGQIAQANALTPLIAVFAYAAAPEDWRDPVSLSESGRAPYLRSLTRRMLREAQALGTFPRSIGQAIAQT